MQLKGTTGTSRKVIKWTLEDKVAVYRAVKVDATSPRDAFAAVAQDKGVELPESYTKFPHSHVWRFKKEFEKAIAKQDVAIVSALRQAGLLSE